MYTLQQYSSRNNLEKFVEFFSHLMETPHSENSIEQLRHFLPALLPFFIFDPVHTTQHTQLVGLLEQNIRNGNLYFGGIRGGIVDIQNFIHTLGNTSNLNAVEALYPVFEALSATHSFDGFSLDRIYDKMAQLQQQRISQALETGVPSPVKRKI